MCMTFMQWMQSITRPAVLISTQKSRCQWLSLPQKTFKRSKLGCPQDDKRAEVFLEVASYLEDNDDELITINDLIDLMNQKLANTDYDTYGYTYMKTRL